MPALLITFAYQNGRAVATAEGHDEIPSATSDNRDPWPAAAAVLTALLPEGNTVRRLPGQAATEAHLAAVLRSLGYEHEVVTGWDRSRPDEPFLAGVLIRRAKVADHERRGIA